MFQVQGYFDLPVDNITAEPAFRDWIKENHLKQAVLVTPNPEVLCTGVRVHSKYHVQCTLNNEHCTTFYMCGCSHIPFYHVKWIISEVAS